MWKQLFKSVGGLGRSALEDVFEVAIRIMPVELCGLDQAHDGCRALTGAKRSGKEPVRSSQSDWPDPVFDVVFVDGQLAIIEAADQRRATSQAVLDGFPCRRAIRDLAALSGKPLPRDASLVG